jgi:hypothetical protein
MKKILILAICAIMTQAAFMCGDSSNPADPNNPGGNNSGTGNNTASITLNGGGYSNQTVNFSGVVGGFAAGENGTALTSTAATRLGSDSVRLSVAFPGQANGTFTWEDGLGVFLGFDSQQSVGVPLTGSTIVTSYGAVGSQIVCTFTGQILLANSPTQRQDTIRVTGRFSGQRIPNQ